MLDILPVLQGREDVKRKWILPRQRRVHWAWNKGRAAQTGSEIQSTSPQSMITLFLLAAMASALAYAIFKIPSSAQPWVCLPRTPKAE